MKNNSFLSIETSLNRIFLVVGISGRLISSSTIKFDTMETVITFKIDELLKRAHTELRELNFIFVSLGPGSFTGIRVGLSAAKAISIAAEKKLIGYSNFEAIFTKAIMEKKIDKDEKVGVLVNADKTNYYYQEFSKNNSNEKMFFINDFEYFIKKSKSKLIGNFDKDHKLKNYFACLPDKYSIAKMVYLRNKKQKTEILPFYIKEHYAKKKRQ